MAHSNEVHDDVAPTKALAATTDVNMTEAPVTWKAYLLCAFASFGGIFFGMLNPSSLCGDACSSVNRL
jgi:hypothetical protein